MSRPRATAGPDSRARLIAAATADFAAHGYAGASMDRIARKARLNKAMIYYHFHSKDRLYREIIREATSAMASRVQHEMGAEASAEGRLAAFVTAFTLEAVQRPNFPRLLLREMVEQGRHLDPETAKAWLAVPDAFIQLFEDGVASGRFRPVNPLVAYVAVIGPVVLLLASGPARRRVARLGKRPLPHVDPGELRAQVQTLALGMLGLLPPPSESRNNGEHHESHRSPSRVRRRPAGRRDSRRRLP